jgi:hypothetical protein
MAGLSPADVGPFLARLTRLDPAALVRLRPAGPGAVVLWGRVPWGVLATRTVPGPAIADTTVAATELLTSITHGDGRLPPPRDRDWRWALPSGPGRAVETLPAGELRRLGSAAAETLRAARGQVGERMLRDTLLEHVPIVVTGDGDEIEIRQGLVQALLRMAFIGTDGSTDVTVRIAGTWVGLAAEHGSVWLQNRPSLAISLAK